MITKTGACASLVWRALGVLALLWLASGCYSRAELKGRAVAPKATVQLDFQVDPALKEALFESAMTQAQFVKINNQEPDPAAIAAEAEREMNALPVGLAGQMRADLLKYQIAVPLAGGEEADLRLGGLFRVSSTSGLALDWQLVESRTGAVVRAGVVEQFTLSGDLGYFADQILGDLVQVDLNRYAGRELLVAGGGGGLVAEGVDDPPAAATRGQDAWAVIIGVENYREGLTPATHAEADAQAFAAYAEKTLGVPPSHIKTLLGERAGRADIASALEEWLPRNAVASGGRVYVFFSGHGAPDPESGDAYLVPYDADPAYLKTRGYAVKDLYAALGRLKGQESLVFLDACFSGSGDRSVLAAGTRPLVPVKEVRPVGGVVSLAAASAKQTTGASGRSAHGLFTHHLLAGMQGKADANGDRAVSVGELGAYVKEKVEEEARLQNREQTPTLSAPSGVDVQRLPLVEGLP